jgi:hypothetical protein
MNLTKKQREEIENRIEDLKCVSTSVNGTWKINYIDENQKDFDIIIINPENPLSYLKFICFNCKKEIPQKTNRQTLCEDCYKNKEKERKKDWARNCA